jgi:hypothetical protein
MAGGTKRRRKAAPTAAAAAAPKAAKSSSNKYVYMVYFEFPCRVFATRHAWLRCY